MNVLIICHTSEKSAGLVAEHLQKDERFPADSILTCLHYWIGLAILLLLIICHIGNKLH